MSAPVIDTPRLRLRGHVRADFEAYAALFASERARHMGGPLDRAQSWAAFGADVAGWELNGFGAWAVDLREGGGCVGQVGLNHPPHFPERELGWLLYDGFEGHGYATEAAAAARGFAYGVLGWRTVVSYIDPDNSASIAVAERLGAVLDPAAPAPDPGDRVYRHPAPEALQ